MVKVQSQSDFPLPLESFSLLFTRGFHSSSCNCSLVLSLNLEIRERDDDDAERSLSRRRQKGWVNALKWLTNLVVAATPAGWGRVAGREVYFNSAKSNF